MDFLTMAYDWRMNKLEDVDGIGQCAGCLGNTTKTSVCRSFVCASSCPDWQGNAEVFQIPHPKEGVSGLGNRVYLCMCLCVCERDFTGGMWESSILSFVTPFPVFIVNLCLCGS